TSRWLIYDQPHNIKADQVSVSHLNQYLFFKIPPYQRGVKNMTILNGTVPLYEEFLVTERLKSEHRRKRLRQGTLDNATANYDEIRNF
ncbi:hypothetical protein NPIL_105591, partial [Nephila pilipes]